VCLKSGSESDLGVTRGYRGPSDSGYSFSQVESQQLLLLISSDPRNTHRICYSSLLRGTYGLSDLVFETVGGALQIKAGNPQPHWLCGCMHWMHVCNHLVLSASPLK